MESAAEADLLDLRIESIGAGGVGVARDSDGRVVFVPRTVPGDRVLARLVSERRRHATARPVSRSVDGPDRVPAACPAFEAGCGGCRLQHLALQAQREARRRILEDALERIGGVTIPVPATLAAGPPFGYRNRVAFTLRRRGESVTAGYRALDAPDRLLDILHCPLAEPALASAWVALRVAWGGGARALPAGPALRLTLRASRTGGIALLVQGGDPAQPGDPDRIADGVPGLESYHWRDTAGRRHRLGGRPTFRDRWAGIDVSLRPEAFVQVNRHASEVIDRYIDDRIGSPAGLRILDLYAGIGLRAIHWAASGARVIACEQSRDAVETGREAAAAQGVRVRFDLAPVERSLRGLPPTDLIVVNPPRRGLSRRVAEELTGRAGGPGTRLLYVSCDPATLARDLHRLAPAWRPISVQPFDAFPQTAHVETIAWLDDGRRSR